jgi:hypothetical protein
MEIVPNGFRPANRNQWPMAGNGILSGLTLGTRTPVPEDPNTQFQSL